MARINPIALLSTTPLGLLVLLIVLEFLRLRDSSRYEDLRSRLGSLLNQGNDRAQVIAGFQIEGFIVSEGRGQLALSPRSELSSGPGKECVFVTLPRAIPRVSVMLPNITANLFFDLIFDESGKLIEYQEGKYVNFP